VRFDNAAIDDFPVMRADGSVLFLLANVVDDIDMRISHVVRGEEHLPNTPKQQLMWQALDHEPPVWAHLPLLVNEKRQKLSKRRDKVALEDYKAAGYLAEAMRNYLMLLGWAPSGDREILPWPALIEEFRLDEVNLSPAFFDIKKLRAINGSYIRELAGRGIHRPQRAVADRPGRAVAARSVQRAGLRPAGVAGADQGRGDVGDYRQRGFPVSRRAGLRRGVPGPRP